MGDREEVRRKIKRGTKRMRELGASDKRTEGQKEEKKYRDAEV
jgi:hypothetical protein